ncbi:MAG: hypothetical protein ACPGWR_27545 [Ardenticatenaceae bacterium]
MSTYKVVDSTISVLYCAKCANEDLEMISPGRLYCADCGMDTSFDTSQIKVGRLKGTKYKMRAKRSYTFREIVDEARQDAFSEVYVPSPDPGRGRVGWRKKKREALTEEQIRMAGVDDDPGKGWRSEGLMEIMAKEALAQEENQENQENQKNQESQNNGQDNATCAL